MADAQILPRVLQIGADEQGFAIANDKLGECVAQFAAPFGQDAIFSHLEFEPDLFALLKRDVEMAGIEDLPQFALDGAENLVLIEARADCLADIRQQFVLFRAAVSVVADHVVFESQAQLQSESHHQPRSGRAECSPFRVRKQDHAKIVLARLQIDRRQIPDVRGGENLFEFRERPH